MKMLRGKRKLILKVAVPTAGSLCQQGAVRQPVQLPEALPCKGIMFANRPTGRGGLLLLLYRGAKPVPATAGLTLPREQWGTWRALAPHTPHSWLPLLLHTPSGPRGAPGSPAALSKTKQLHWPSHRHWGRRKIMKGFSSPGLGAGTRDWGAGAHGAGAWWVRVA